MAKLQPDGEEAGVGSWEGMLLEWRYTGGAKPGLFEETAARDGEFCGMLILLERSSSPHLLFLRLVREPQTGNLINASFGS